MTSRGRKPSRETLRLRQKAERQVAKQKQRTIELEVRRIQRLQRLKSKPKGWRGESERHRQAALKGRQAKQDAEDSLLLLQTLTKRLDEKPRVVDFFKPEDFETPSAGEHKALQKAGFTYLDKIEVSTVSGMVELATVIGISQRGVLTVIYDNGKLDHIGQRRAKRLGYQRLRMG